jgi:hypothetical protein
MNESSKVPAKFESIIIIPSGVMNFQSRKLRKKFYTYAHTPYLIIIIKTKTTLLLFNSHLYIYIKKIAKNYDKNSNSYS